MNKKRMFVAMDELSPMIEDLIAAGTDVTLTVTGNSMCPLWHHLKNSVVLTGCDPYALKKGDVPLYRRADGRYILHRIVRVHKDTFDLAGDAQTEVERGLEKHRIIAVVKAFHRGGKLIPVTARKYRLYVLLWSLVLPLRRIIFKVYGATYGKYKAKKQR